MLKLQKVKEISGKIELPPNSDYFFLSLLVSLSSDKPVLITPVHDSPLNEQYKTIFSAHLEIDHKGVDCFVIPKNQNDSIGIMLPYDIIPFRDFTIPFILGLKKKIILSKFPSECFPLWQAKATKFNIDIGFSQNNDLASLHVSLCGNFQPTDKIIHQNDIHCCLGLALGLKKKININIDYQFQSPLRYLLNAFGYTISVRNNCSKRGYKKPMFRRMQFLSPKLRRRQKSTFSFSIKFDPCQQDLGEKIVVTLPGDDILASVFLTAKALIPKGQLLLTNVCIEPWSNSMISLLRKMECNFAIEQTRVCSFGSIGKVCFKKINLVGQKMDCKPLFQYIRQLPLMIILVTFAKGQSVFRSLDELRNETPLYIDQMLNCIDIIGGRYGEMPDGIVIDGIREYDGFDISKNYSAGLNAACAVAGLKCNGKSNVADDSILHRWPRFSSIINSVCDINNSD